MVPARRSLVGTRGRPRVACPTCGLLIPLDEIVALGAQRSLHCQRCHGVETWELGQPCDAVAEVVLRD